MIINLNSYSFIFTLDEKNKTYQSMVHKYIQLQPWQQI